MLLFACPACGLPLKVKDEMAGKKVKCPGCGRAVVAAAERTAAWGAPGSRPAGAGDPHLPPQAEGRERMRAHGNSEGAERSAAASGGDTVGNDGPPGGGELTAFLAPPQAPDEIGRLGPYGVLAVLGQGGMGVVFRARDPHLDRLVALKAMLPSMAGIASARERFFREARAAAALKHPHVVTIFQVGEDRGAPYLVMEYLEGEALDERLRREGRLPLSEVVRIGREVAEGLAAAHARGLVHRDVKPGNIWLEDRGDKRPACPPASKPASGPLAATGGHVKLLDFGLARAVADQTHLTQSGAIVGTPAYMAPEQAQGDGVDHRCDLFSLGCVLYRMATGTLPFQGRNTIEILHKLAVETPKPPREVNPEVPEVLSQLILRLLAKKAEDRPATAREVADALAALVEEQTAVLAPAGKPTVVPPDSFRRRRRGLAVVLAVLLVVLTAVGLGLALKGRPSATVADPEMGVLVVQAPEGAAEVWIDGEARGVVGAGKVARLAVAPGKHTVAVKQGEEELYVESFALGKGGEMVIEAKWPPKQFTNSVGMEFVRLRKGTFPMGGGGGKLSDKEVDIAHDFYLGKYEVTQEQWQALMGSNPSHFSRTGGGKDTVNDVPDEDLKRFPVELVSWEDCQQFLKVLNFAEQGSGYLYRLPREAEWEYGCRGGPSSKPAQYAFHFYLDKPTNQLLPDQANFNQVLKRTCKVGSYPPNRLGLYDMHGNVLEWCEDRYDGGSSRVIRGGCWNSVAGDCRASIRFSCAPSLRSYYLGFRLAAVPSGVK
jgi:serine/threonine protein kinase/formylglycine-generating enzyme required for sulfatase activity